MDKAQLKIQEMAFVLLALVVFGVIVFLFYARLQSGNIVQSAKQLDEQRALSLRDKIVALPEIKCAKALCIDKYKASIIKDYGVEGLFQGISKAEIIQIYPGPEKIVLFSSGENNSSYTSYSTFVNLCEQENIGGIFNYNCGLAILKINIY